MRRLIKTLSVSLLLTLASAASAQTPVTCGIVDIDGPEEVGPSAPLVLKVKTTMLHTTKPEFKWTLSAGKITTGQGTDEITVDTAWLGGQLLTATVELSGAPLNCKAAASKLTRIKPPPPTRCPLDKYGDIKFEWEKARLDNFVIQVLNFPLSTGYILMSAGQVTFEKEAEKRLNRAKNYLVKVRGIDPNRIVTVDCGYSTELTAQLWVAPLGAEPPDCSVYGKIPLSEVKFTKPNPKSSKKRR
jgi:hypothetical protein